MNGSVLLKNVFLGAIILLFTVGSALSEEGIDWRSGNYQPIVQNQLYLDECGSCHWAFLPSLLHITSWRKLMDGLADHFGEDVSLDAEDERALRAYLEKVSPKYKLIDLSKLPKSSPHYSTKKRITYIRITDKPKMIREHRSLKRWLRNKPEVKTFSNCIGCHKGADYGSWEVN